ncbi:unnamed protein product, partial [Coccothraustes coccothraustes]
AAFSCPAFPEGEQAKLQQPWSCRGKLPPCAGSLLQQSHSWHCRRAEPPWDGTVPPPWHTGARACFDSG